MANHHLGGSEDQSTVEREPSLDLTKKSPVMEKFRRALEVMITTFQSDLSSEDFLSRKILELSTSSVSIEEFLQNSMEFMEQSLAEHRRQTETMRASLRTIQAFLTSFIDDERQPSSSGRTMSSDFAPCSNPREPSRSATPFIPPPNSLASPFSPAPLFRTGPSVSDNTRTRRPSGRNVKSEPSEMIMPFKFMPLASPFSPIPERRRGPPPDLNQIFPPHLRRRQTQTEEDLSLDVIQYFEGPLIPPTPPSSPQAATTPPNRSTPSSFAHRPHPFVLRQIIRRHHLIRTPDGRTLIPPFAPSSRYVLDNTSPPPMRRPRFRSAEPSPYYHVTKRPRRRLAFMKSKDKTRDDYYDDKDDGMDNQG